MRYYDSVYKAMLIVVSISVVLTMFALLEPREKMNCSPYVVIDNVFNESENERTIVFENGDGVESKTVTIEEYYAYEVGDEIQACWMVGKYSHMRYTFIIQDGG